MLCSQSEYLMSGVSVAVVSAHCSTLTLSPHGQTTAVVCICLFRLTLSLSSSCRWYVFRHRPSSTHIQKHTFSFATGHGHTAGKRSDVKPREIWEASRGESTNKYIFPPWLSLSPLQSNTNRHVQVHTRTRTHRNPSQGHLANSVVRGTYEQAVSHVNISCWCWTGWLKPPNLFLENGDVWSCLHTYYKLQNIPRCILKCLPTSPFFFAAPMKQSNFWHNQSLMQPRHELHLQEAESAFSEALCVGIMFS